MKMYFYIKKLQSECPKKWKRTSVGCELSMCPMASHRHVRRHNNGAIFEISDPECRRTSRNIRKPNTARQWLSNGPLADVQRRQQYGEMVLLHFQLVLSTRCLMKRSVF